MRDEKISLDVVIRGNYLQVTNKVKVTSAISEELEQEFQHFWSQYGTRRLVGRDIILSSFCPEVSTYSSSIIGRNSRCLNLILKSLLTSLLIIDLRAVFGETSSSHNPGRWCLQTG